MIRRVQTFLLGGLLLICLVWGAESECDAQSAPESEKVAQFLQEAQTSFDEQEFSAGLELYQRVLVLDPANQTAREKISEIVDIYKNLEEIARKEEELEKAELLHQQQRDITRYLLKILTSQLEASIQSYRAYKTAEKDGQEIKELISPVLENIINVLTELKNLYQGVSGDKERTKQIVERIAKTLEHYEKELKYYNERE